MRSAVDFIVIGLAILTLGCAIVFLPAMELIPAQVEPGSIAPGLSPVRDEGAMNIFKNIGSNIAGALGQSPDLKTYVEGDPKGIGEKSPGELRVYAMWAVGFSFALIFAALAFSLLGRSSDADEVTVLPVKK
jgi:hypothetical protein